MQECGGNVLSQGHVLLDLHVSHNQVCLCCIRAQPTGEL